MGPVDLRNDRRTLFACQCGLLVISEAAKRLGPREEELCPGFPWRDIRGIGNRLRVPCVRHLRIPVATVLRLLVGGLTAPEDIRECLRFAAASAMEREMPLPHSA